jgi:hypothetical protein
MVNRENCSVFNGFVIHGPGGMILGCKGWFRTKVSDVYGRIMFSCQQLLTCISLHVGMKATKTGADLTNDQTRLYLRDGRVTNSLIPSTECSIKNIRRPITPPFQRRRCEQLFLVFFLLRPQIMATELDVSKSRRFDIAMSRRTRRSTSLVTCFQDQYVLPLTQRHQDAKLKTLLQCQDAELQSFHQLEDAEQQTPCLCEDQELRVPRAPQQHEAGKEKTLEQYEDEQEKEPSQYQDHEQKKQKQHEDVEKKPSQYLDDEKLPQRFQCEDDKTSKFQDEKQVTPKQYEYDGEEKTPEQYQDAEHKAPQQCQDIDEPASKQDEEEGEEQDAEQRSCDMEQNTPEKFQGVKKLAPPPCSFEGGVPRFSLQELIQEKQLPVREAKVTSKLAGHGENVIAGHKVSGSVGGATGGTTLAMVIRRPEGGKKSTGVIRRCVKALNQMIKAKHGSKKSTPL